MTMCEPCRGLAERWVCRPMPPAPVRIHTIDFRPQQIESNRRNRVADFYAETRRQVAAVRVNCDAGRHAPVCNCPAIATPVSPRVPSGDCPTHGAS